MTAPFGEGCGQLELAETLAHHLEMFIEHLDSTPHQTIRDKVVEVGEPRQHALFAAHELYWSRENIFVPATRFSLGPFPCGVVENENLVVKWHHVSYPVATSHAARGRRYTDRLPVRGRLGQQLTNRWQVMPLEWLLPEEMYILNRSFQHLSSKARAD